MNTRTKRDEKNQDPATVPTVETSGAKRNRVRDVRLDERDAQVKAWKDSGKKGVPDSVKRDDFRRVAQRRLDDALNALRLLANCSRRATYGYTVDQAAALIGAIHAEVADLERAFQESDTSANSVTL